ncbi:axin interactor, dorsalization-associated protein-like [Callospermophilus lateralis]
MTLLTIRIEKIGLKDAGQCIDPYITVSVKDLNGIDLTPVQDTPVASRKEDTYVHFNVDIELQKHIEKLTKELNDMEKCHSDMVEELGVTATVQLSSLNSNTTSLKKGLPAPSVLLSWRWMRLNLGQL